MDQRQHKADFAADIMAIPALNTVNLSTSDTLKEQLRYLGALVTVVSERMAEVSTDIRSEATVNFGSESIERRILDFFAELIDEAKEAVAEAEENEALARPYSIGRHFSGRPVLANPMGDA